MPLINLILLSSKSTLLFSLCDAELDPINLSLLPAGKMLSVVSRQHRRDFRRGRSILLQVPLCPPLLVLESSSSSWDTRWHSPPREFQQHPMGGFPGSSAAISASFPVGLTGVFPWSWVATPSLYQRSELLCHPVGPGTQRLRRDLDLITAVGKVEGEGCSLLGCSVSALEILAIPYISSSLFFSACCTPS